VSGILIGNVFDILPTLPAASINCVVTSPPYWGLRDYGSDGQLGLEPTPEEYVAKLVAVFREVWRVLRDDGTLWLNLGDSYSSGGRTTQVAPTLRQKGHDDASGKAGYLSGFAVRPGAVEGLAGKQLIGIPWRVAFALQADGWYLRSDIIWSKPNPMPESVTDRPTKAHEYVFLLSKAARYWYDAEAVKEAHTKTGTPAHLTGGRGERAGTREGLRGAVVGRNRDFEQHGHQVGHSGEAYPLNGRNKRTVWTIATQPYPEAHFATYPEKLVEPCVLAGCPVGGTVLDPFAGSGTTGAVAYRLGRKFIGIELNPEYAAMAERRIAPHRDQMQLAVT
jgi:DNA modification methylase